MEGCILHFSISDILYTRKCDRDVMKMEKMCFVVETTATQCCYLVISYNINYDADLFLANTFSRMSWVSPKSQRRQYEQWWRLNNSEYIYISFSSLFSFSLFFQLKIALRCKRKMKKKTLDETQCKGRKNQNGKRSCICFHFMNSSLSSSVRFNRFARLISQVEWRTNANFSSIHHTQTLFD